MHCGRGQRFALSFALKPIRFWVLSILFGINGQSQNNLKIYNAHKLLKNGYKCTWYSNVTAVEILLIAFLLRNETGWKMFWYSIRIIQTFNISTCCLIKHRFSTIIFMTPKRRLSGDSKHHLEASATLKSSSWGRYKIHSSGNGYDWNDFETLFKEEGTKSSQACDWGKHSIRT